MQKYETMYICDSQMEDDQIESLIEKFSGVITRQGGEITNLDKWGRRKLAYEIDKHTEGYYVVKNFSAPPEACQELERAFKIADGIIRYLIVREED